MIGRRSQTNRRKARLAATASLVVLIAYALLAYLAAPEYWRLRDVGLVLPGTMLTTTGQGIPGDPINVGLVGSREDVARAFHAAGWDPADRITLRTSVDIGLSVLLDRPYTDAPVSTLLFDGKPQDLAFEKPVGSSADQRHHVRFWQILQAEPLGPPLWLGATSFDRGVGLSHDTGQITHHIGPDLDAERKLVIADLTDAGWIASTTIVDGVGPTTTGRNGGGDPYVTDGKAVIGDLVQHP